MADIVVSLSDLRSALAPELGEAHLIPGLSLGNSDPSLLPSVPSVMGSFELVPSSRYRFEYNSLRYLRLGYLLERDGEYESGELDIISKAAPFFGEMPEAYSPALYLTKNVVHQTAGSLGVAFSVAADQTTFPSKPSFGLAYKITTVSPAVFPVLRAYIIKVLPLRPEITNAPEID